jgi:hypothetical protein
MFAPDVPAVGGSVTAVATIQAATNEAGGECWKIYLSSIVLPTADANLRAWKAEFKWTDESTWTDYTGERATTETTHTSDIWPIGVASRNVQVRIVCLNRDGVPGATWTSGTLTVAPSAGGSINANRIASSTLGAALAKVGGRLDIVDLGVTNAKLADAAVTTAKLAGLSVDNSKLAALAVDAAKLANSAVTSTKIANAAVGSAAIAAAAIGTAHIANAAIVDAHISSLTAGKISGGTIAANVLYAGTIAATQVAAGTLQAGVIYSGTVNASQLNAGTVTVNSTMTFQGTGGIAVVGGGNVSITPGELLATAGRFKSAGLGWDIVGGYGNITGQGYVDAGGFKVLGVAGITEDVSYTDGSGNPGTLHFVGGIYRGKS